MRAWGYGVGDFSFSLFDWAGRRAWFGSIRRSVLSHAIEECSCAGPLLFDSIPFGGMLMVVFFGVGVFFLGVKEMKWL